MDITFLIDSTVELYSFTGTPLSCINIDPCFVFFFNLLIIHIKMPSIKQCFSVCCYVQY